MILLFTVFFTVNFHSRYNLELKQDDEYGYYYEFPLVFEREKLNNKDGKLLDWVGTNNTKISATYVDGSICIPVTGVEPTMAVNNGQKIFATPGQEYAEIPLNLYNVPDTEGITVAFKTDAEGTPTLALLKDAYQLYEAADAFVNLGKWEANPKGLSWGVPSSGKQMVKGSDFVNGDVFLSLYYNIPDEETVKSIAKANNLELKQDAEHGTYYEFPLVFEREKLNNKDGKLLAGGRNAPAQTLRVCFPLTEVYECICCFVQLISILQQCQCRSTFCIRLECYGDTFGIRYVIQVQRNFCIFLTRCYNDIFALVNSHGRTIYSQFCLSCSSS